jgi:predicted nucleotidyltransferase
MTNNQNLIQNVRKLLSNYPEIKVATLFGSASSNRLTDKSDIDVGIAGETEFPYEFKNKVMVELSLALSREIDIVDMRSVSGSILKQSLCSGILIKKESQQALVFLIKRLWYNQSDMMPLVDRIEKAHIRKFLNG